ncbi:MAG: acyltransferase [Dysgonamonadaceae bacterium]|nr:acyltransferase [Dysgonamonadaceae bacterium]
MFPVRGKNNIIINKGTLFNVKYDIIGDNNVIEISKGAVLSNMMIFMRGNNHHLKIGEYVKYKRGSVWFEDENCVIEIGEKTTIESAHLAVTEPKRKIIIGYDCMFSNSIEFRTGDSHSIIDNETKKRINFAQDIIVGNHVWIGANSIILKGAKIGDNSIVGINSIVTKAFPNNSIVSGIPAKVIKDKVDWVRERINYS